MVTLTYSNVDGVERISDGLQTYERARFNIITGAQILYLCMVNYPTLREDKRLICLPSCGVVLEREGDMYKIRLSSGDYTVFLEEIWERVQYALRSTAQNKWYVAKLDGSSKTWQPVSELFRDFVDAKTWCNKRNIKYNRLKI